MKIFPKHPKLWLIWKNALPSNFATITLHVEKSSISRFWLVPMTNNSYISGIRLSLITSCYQFQGSYQDSDCSWMTYSEIWPWTGSIVIWLLSWRDRIWFFICWHPMYADVCWLLIYPNNPFIFKDHTGWGLVDLRGVLHRSLCPFRPFLWQVEVLAACRNADYCNYNFMYLLRQWNSPGISCYLPILFVTLTFLCSCQEWSIWHIGNAKGEGCCYIIFNSSFLVACHEWGVNPEIQRFRSAKPI